MAKLGVQIVGDAAGLKAALGQSLAMTAKWATSTEEATARVTAAFDGASTAALRTAVAGDKLALSFARYGEGSLGAAAATVRYRKELDSLAASQTAAMRTVGRSLTTFVTLPMALVAYESVKMSVKFQQEMLKIQTQAGASAAEVKRLSGAVLDLAKTSPQGPVQLAEGLYHLESIGLRGAKAMDVLKESSIAAGIGTASLEEAASALGGAVVSNIRGAQDYTQAMGTLQATIGAGNMTMTDLLEALGTGLLPKAKNAGVSLKEVGAALAVLTDRGIHARQAATQLGTTFALMVAPSKVARHALKDMGIGSDELSKKLQGPGGLGAVLETLRAGMEKVGRIQGKKDILEAFGRSRQSGAILTLVESLGSALSNYGGKLEQIDRQQQRYAQNQKAYLESPAYKLHAAWSTLQADMIKLGNALTPTVTNALKLVAQDIDAVATAFGSLPKPIKEAIGIALAGLAIGGPLLLGLAAIRRALIALRTSEVLAGIGGIGGAATAADAEVMTLRASLLGLGALSIAPIVIPIEYKLASNPSTNPAYGTMYRFGKWAAGQYGGGDATGFAGSRKEILRAITTARELLTNGTPSYNIEGILAKRYPDLGLGELDTIMKIARERNTVSNAAGGAGSEASAKAAHGIAASAAAQAAAAGKGKPTTPVTKDYTPTRIEQLNLALAKNPNSVEAINAKLAYDREAAAFAEKRIKEGRGNPQLVKSLEAVYADENSLRSQLASLKKKQDKTEAEFKIPMRLQLAQAAAALTPGTADDNKANAAIAAYINSQLPHLKGQARLTALQDLKGVQASASGFALPMKLQVAEAKAEAIGSPAQVQAALQAMKDATLQALHSGTLSLQSQKDAWDELKSLNQQMAQSFTVPKKMTLALAKAEAIGTPDQVKSALLAMKQSTIAALKYGKLGIDSQIAAWQELKSINDQLSNTVSGSAQAVVASTHKLTAGLGLTRAQRIALEQRYSQAEAHGGRVPTGLGVGGGGSTSTVTINVHGDPNPERTAQRIMSEMDRRTRHTAVQRRGGNAGR